MRRPLADLASRFRQAIADERAAEARAHAEEEARQQEAQLARSEVLAELHAFAKAVGLTVASPNDGLSWHHGERSVVWEPMGVHDRLRVQWTEKEAIEGRAYREPELHNRWVLCVGQGQQEVRTPLLEAGVVRLLTDGLGLPDPTVAPPSAPGATDPTDAVSSTRRL